MLFLFSSLDTLLCEIQICLIIETGEMAIKFFMKMGIGFCHCIDVFDVFDVL